MEFKEENLSNFYTLFQKVRGQISAFPGCLTLKIYSDKSDKSVIFTYSEWVSEEHLNHYRSSTLFRNTWAETRTWFKAAAAAWSLEELI